MKISKDVHWLEIARKARAEEAAGRERSVKHREDVALKTFLGKVYASDEERVLPAGISITDTKCLRVETRSGAIDLVVQMDLTLTFGQDTLEILITCEQNDPGSIELITLLGDGISLADVDEWGLLSPPYKELLKVYEAGLERKATLAKYAEFQARKKAKTAKAKAEAEVQARMKAETVKAKAEAEAEAEVQARMKAEATKEK